VNAQINAVITWLAQSIGAGVAAGFAMVAAGADLSQKHTWAAIGTTIITTAWAHIRNSPFPDTTPGTKP
jgi:hypothetical protein